MGSLPLPCLLRLLGFACQLFARSMRGVGDVSPILQARPPCSIQLPSASLFLLLYSSCFIHLALFIFPFASSSLAGVLFLKHNREQFCKQACLSRRCVSGLPACPSRSRIFPALLGPARAFCGPVPAMSWGIACGWGLVECNSTLHSQLRGCRQRAAATGWLAASAMFFLLSGCCHYVLPAVGPLALCAACCQAPWAVCGSQAAVTVCCLLPGCCQATVTVKNFLVRCLPAARLPSHTSAATGSWSRR